jgi:hypothetical protein
MPKPLIRAVNWPDLKAHITVDAVVTVVDAVGLATGELCDRVRVQKQRLADDSLDHETPIEELFLDQLSCADLVLVSKRDLVDDEKFSEITKIITEWDYNLSLGNANYCEGAITEGFEVNTDCGNTNPFWWERMLEDPAYRDLTRCRWEEYRSDAWSNASIHSTIDSLANLLGAASIRDHARWPRLGQWVWPNAFVGDTYEEELDFMRDWIDDRLDWLDLNILGDCEAGCTATSRVTSIQTQTMTMELASLVRAPETSMATWPLPWQMSCFYWQNLVAR